MTLEEIARRAREDPVPLRGQEGGAYTAEHMPEVLARQHREFQSWFGESGGGSLPPWVRYAGLAVLALVLAGAGAIAAPFVLGLQGSAVAGAGSPMAGVAPWGGAVAGLLVTVVMGWYLLRPSGGGQVKRGSTFDQVYGHARITQVEYRNTAGETVDVHVRGARRVVVRRMRTYLLRAAFADRQQGIFVAGPATGTEARFRAGEIRLQTTRDLSRITGPWNLYDGEALTGRWQGICSVRWWVDLLYPLETGALAREVDVDKGAQARQWLVHTYGWVVMLIGAITGLVLFGMAVDARYSQDDEEIPDRTPAEAPTARARAAEPGWRLDGESGGGP